MSRQLAFETASDLTQAIKDGVREFRALRRGSRSRREQKRLLLSQMAYRDHFLGKAVAA